MGRIRQTFQVTNLGIYKFCNAFFRLFVFKKVKKEKFSVHQQWQNLEETENETWFIIILSVNTSGI